MTDKDLLLARLAQEMRHKKEVQALTDGELASALIEEVWTKLKLWERSSVLIDEAITRLKRADTCRRWQERKERRAAREEEFPPYIPG